MAIRYVAFRDAVHATLSAASSPMTWRELRAAAHLPYERPCPTWVARLEREIGLRRETGPTRAKLWSLEPSSESSEAG